MDVESQKTIDEAIDRLRDEVAVPIIAELSKIRELLGSINGASITLALGRPPLPASAPKEQ